MSDRRRSVHLAAAVSSILSAPAVALGAGLAMALAAAPLRQAQETATQLTGFVVDARRHSRSPARRSRSCTCRPARLRDATTECLGPVLGDRPAGRRPLPVTAKAEGMQEVDRRGSLHAARAAHFRDAGCAADRPARGRRGHGRFRTRRDDRRRQPLRRPGCARAAVHQPRHQGRRAHRSEGLGRPDQLRRAGNRRRQQPLQHDHRRRRAPERRLRPQQQRLSDAAQPAVGRCDRGRLRADGAVLGRVRPSSAARRSTS